MKFKNTILKVTAILFLQMGFLLTSCDNESGQLEVSEKTDTSFRTKEEAISIAESFLSTIEQQKTETRGNRDNRKVDNKNTFAVYSKNTRTPNSQNEILYYVVNFQDSLGFAIVTAEKGAVDVLALTEKGTFNGEADNDIDGFNVFMDLAEQYISHAPSLDLQPITPSSYTDTLYTRGFHLLNTMWGQVGRMATFCPNGKVGCAPLAVAEILSFYKYPTIVSVSYPNAGISTVNLDWDQINLHIRGDSVCSVCTASDAAHTSLAHLCRQLGHQMNCSYDPGDTSTTTLKISNCLRDLGYTVNNWTYYTSNACVSPLKKRHPIIMAGLRNTEQGLSGHTWLVDGYLQRIINEYEYAPLVNGLEHWEVSRDTATYNHINWGWGGNNNGYYYDGIFDRAQCFRLDSEDLYNSVPRDYNIDIHYLEAYR